MALIFSKETCKTKRLRGHNRTAEILQFLVWETLVGLRDTFRSDPKGRSSFASFTIRYQVQEVQALDGSDADTAAFSQQLDIICHPSSSSVR